MILISTLVLSSCKDEPNSPSQKTNSIASLLGYNGSAYTYNELYSQYNTGNLNGVLVLKKEVCDVYVYSQEQGRDVKNTYSSFDCNTEAALFNTNYLPIRLSGFVVNAISLEEYDSGKYRSFNNQTETYFNNTKNKILIEENDDFAEYVDSVYFGDEIRIMGYQRDDTLHISKNISINWVGGTPNSKIQISLRRNRPINYIAPDKYNSSGLSFIIDNSGNFPFLANSLKPLKFEPGYYDLTVESFEPQMKSFPNGKQLLVIGHSSHRITVYLAE